MKKICYHKYVNNVEKEYYKKIIGGYDDVTFNDADREYKEIDNINKKQQEGLESDKL